MRLFHLRTRPYGLFFVLHPARRWYPGGGVTALSFDTLCCHAVQDAFGVHEPSHEIAAVLETEVFVLLQQRLQRRVQREQRLGVPLADGRGGRRRPRRVAPGVGVPPSGAPRGRGRGPSVCPPVGRRRRVGGAAAEPRRFCADARLPGRVRRRGRASRGGAGSRRRRPWEGGVHHCPQQPDADHWRRRRCCGRRPGRWRCHLPLYAQPQRWGRGPRPSRRRQRRRRWRGAEELHGGRGRRRWSWVGRPRGTLHRPCAARERRRKQRRRSGPLPVR